MNYQVEDSHIKISNIFQHTDIEYNDKDIELIFNYENITYLMTESHVYSFQKDSFMERSMIKYIIVIIYLLISIFSYLMVHL